MLIGEYLHSIDQKGRLNFPSRLREAFGESFIITKGLDNCLFCYSLSEWERLEEKISSLPISKSRNLQRFLFAGAISAEPDKQGRVLIPQNLRDYALLSKDVMVIGASNRAEIWDREQYEKVCGDIGSDDVAAAMDELGF